jgi:hypothetical protein
MGIYQSNGDRLQNIRISLQIVHERNKELASYIRLTDVAIWGFLGITFIQLFNNFRFLLFNIPIFLGMVIISMWLWRLRVRDYQKNIVTDYQRIFYCENELDIPDEISVQHKIIEEYFSDILSISTKEQRYEELVKRFQNGQYIDKNHLKLDNYAKTIKWLAIIGFIAWIMCVIFFLIFHSQLCIF